MSKYAVIAIGYNRPDGVKRLLDSLETADYDGDEVDLIVSIDNSGSDRVEKLANAYDWTHGVKTVRTFPERQGLRKHILKCGDYVHEYEAIAVFEDDIIASRSFYHYMKAAVNKYQNDDNIAGISLYSHKWNVHANKPFDPSYSGKDCYFMQFAQSWGQVWMRNQWLDFAKWYKEQTEYGDNPHIPSGVKKWPETSWLKYHIKYCIEQNKYFVYPYISFSTCFSDIGEHMKEKDTHLQVPMVNKLKTHFDFPNFSSDQAVYYDSYFERIFANEVIYPGIDNSEISVDLYGMKENCFKKKYLLTVKNLSYKRIASFGLEIKPLEENIIEHIPGQVIKLYDLGIEDKAIKDNSDVQVFQYRFRLYGNTPYLVKCITNKIKRKLKR